MLNGSPRSQSCHSCTRCWTPAGLVMELDAAAFDLRRRPAWAQVEPWINVYQDRAIVIGLHPRAHCWWMPAGASWRLLTDCVMGAGRMPELFRSGAAGADFG